VPVFNGAEYIRELMDSLLAQTFTDFELIVSDNRSTDGTWDLLRSYASRDSRVRLHRNRKNIGACRNWNRVVAMARGDYVALYHADDVYFPTILEREVRALESNNTIGAVFTSVNLIDSHGVNLGYWRPHPAFCGKRGFSLWKLLNHMLRTTDNPLYCPTCMVRREIYDALSYDCETFAYAFDIDMYFRILERYRIRVLPEAQMSYRLSASQGSLTYSVTKINSNELFTVLDRYFARRPRSFPLSTRILYKSHQDWDRTLNAVNALLAGEDSLGRRLTRQSMTPTRFLACFIQPKLVFNLMVSVAFLGAAHLGFGKTLAKLAHKVRRRRRRM